MHESSSDDGVTDRPDPTRSAPDEPAVVESLQAVLSSDVFRRAPRAKDLLAYVVTETLAGRGHLLNERVVSRVALGRPSDIDTRTDASARVQARRTRELLARYYADPACEDEWQITIPTGQYAAVVVHRTPRSSEHVEREHVGMTGGPVLAVVELRHRSSGIDRRVAAGLTESLVQTIARFPGLQVIGPINAGDSPSVVADVLTVGERTQADFILHGGVSTTHDVVRVTVHVSRADSGQVRWSEVFDHDVDSFSGFDAEDEIVARVAAAVGDFGGVVFKEPVRSRYGEPQVAEALRQYYAFLDELTPVTAPIVVAGLVAARELEPENSHVLASLAFVHVVDVLMRGAAAQESIRTSEELARAALRIDPTNSVANNVLAVVALAEGQHSRARKHAEIALELAPYHPGNAYVAGMVLGASGDWARGIAIIRRVVRVNPYGPNHRRTLLAVDALMSDDIALALTEASLLHFPGYIYGPLVRAVCLSEMDLLDEARVELDNVLALSPDFLADPGAIVGAAPTIPADAAEHLAGRVAVLAGRLGR